MKIGPFLSGNVVFLSGLFVDFCYMFLDKEGMMLGKVTLFVLCADILMQKRGGILTSATVGFLNSNVSFWVDLAGVKGEMFDCLEVIDVD
ncbi:hypothetical protein [Flavobacterium plurextorum]|uniref:hypothetical protein n=1 Tax=Flavobacterium plurextorum TaxID=1114867 RepID=UPI00375676E5